MYISAQNDIYYRQTAICLQRGWAFNTLRPRQMDAISQTTFSNAFSSMKMFEFRLKISLKFVPKGPINNIPALVPIMAWRRSGDKPLSEPMMVSLPTHICVTRPQWVKHALSMHDRSFLCFLWEKSARLMLKCVDLTSPNCLIITISFKSDSLD